MKLPATALLTVSFSLVAAAPVFAHHSLSGTYSMKDRATIEGDITEFSLRSPHSFVEVQSKDPRTGQMVTWSVEWASASRLSRQGMTHDTLKPGDHVTITGQPGRNPEEHRLHLLAIRRTSDGWNWERGR